MYNLFDLPAQEFSSLRGKTLKAITALRDREGGEVHQLEFLTDTGEKLILGHAQDCCESVYLADVVGDLADLVGQPILRAEEAVSTETDEDGDRTRWSFYKLATRSGYVDLRWLGRSNGFYSEAVELFVA